MQARSEVDHNILNIPIYFMFVGSLICYVVCKDTEKYFWCFFYPILRIFAYNLVIVVHLCCISQFVHPHTSNILLSSFSSLFPLIYMYLFSCCYCYLAGATVKSIKSEIGHFMWTFLLFFCIFSSSFTVDSWKKNAFAADVQYWCRLWSRCHVFGFFNFFDYIKDKRQRNDYRS